MSTNIIKHNGVYVAGFSYCARKVYYTKHLGNAKRFTDAEAAEFVDLHDNRGRCFRRVNAVVINHEEGEQHGTICRTNHP